MANNYKIQQVLQEYEELGKIMNPKITFINSENRTSGVCYLDCNTIFKTLHMRYDGDIIVLNDTKFKVYNNDKNSKIIVTNSKKDTLNDNVLFRYKGYINSIITAGISGFGQKNTIAIQPIKGNDEPIFINEDENEWGVSSEILRKIELNQGRISKHSINKKRDRAGLSFKNISSKLPPSYNLSNNVQLTDTKVKALGEKCGNCKHIKYPMSKNQTGICHLWKAQVNLPFWCDSWEKKKGE